MPRWDCPRSSLGFCRGRAGTQRFTRLAGPEAALDAITSGNPIAASRALELGLIDVIADDRNGRGHRVCADGSGRDQRPLRLASNLNDKIAGIDAGVFADFRKKTGEQSPRSAGLLGRSSYCNRGPRAPAQRTRPSKSSVMHTTSVVTANSERPSYTCSLPSARRARSRICLRIPALYPFAARRSLVPAPWVAALP